MYLKFEPITANNITTFNAYVNAVRCDGFLKFVKFYDSELPALFKNVTMYTSEQSSANSSPSSSASVISSELNELAEKGKDLSIAYSSLPVRELKKAYEQVVHHRELEFKEVFAEKEIEFKNLSELEKMRYELLFHYGEKLGGYGVIASLDIQELICIYKYFVELQEIDNKKTQELLNKK